MCSRADHPKGNARPSVVVADSGHLTQLRDGDQVVTLNRRTRFEGTALLRDFRITDFRGLSGDYRSSGRGAGSKRYRPDEHAYAVDDRHRSPARS